MIRIRVSALIKEGNSILVVKHRKDNREYFLLPGGGVDFGENLNSALKRELLEELNVHIKIGDLLFIAESISPDTTIKNKRHIISVVFLCELISRNFKIGGDKRVVDYKFLPIEDLKKANFYPDFTQELLEYLIKDSISNRAFSVEWKD